MKKFCRMNEHALLAGVCAGLAYKLEVQTWMVRVGLVLLSICFGVGLIPYILVALFAPKYDTDPQDYQEVCG